MVLIVIFVIALLLSIVFFGIPSTISLFIAMLGFAMLTSLPFLGLPLMVIGIIMFLALRRKR